MEKRSAGGGRAARVAHSGGQGTSGGLAVPLRP